MEIIFLEENYIPGFEEKSAVAIGKFDGLHLGHKKLLQELVKYKSQGFKTIVFSFEKSIMDFLKKEKSQVIATEKEKRELLEACGVDVLAVYPVNEASVNISPESFISEVLVKALNAGVVVAGYDCSFGKFGKGDVALLKKYEQEYDYVCEEIAKVTEESGREISSSYVREEISAGEMEHVCKLLGRPYSFSSIVSHGRALGRTIDMPTANIYPDSEKILPRFGVYFSEVIYREHKYKAVSNIGIKPTVSEEKRPVIETYMFEFEGDLYDQEIEVRLLKFKRSELKFGSIDELKKQMSEDIEAARKFHRNVN